MPVVQNYPVMHPHANAYREQAYTATCLLGSGINQTHELQVTHMIDRNKKNLLLRLIEEENVSFFTTISVRRTFFRRTVIEDCTNVHLDISSNKLVFKQNIPDIYWKINEKSIMSQSGIIINCDKEFAYDQELGLTNFYHGQNILFPKHAVIAHTDWLRHLSIARLFKLHAKLEQPQDTFQSSINLGEDVLRIDISLHPELFTKVGSKQEPFRSHVLCTSLASALSEIKDAYEANVSSESEIEMDENELLEAAIPLKEYLKGHKLSTWETDDFNSVDISSKLFPLIVDSDGCK